MTKNKALRLLVVAILIASAGTASAQFRMDIDLMVPLKASLIADISGLGEGETASASTDIPFTFLIPDFQALYQFDLGIVRLGGGARLFTIILESLVYPVLFGEVQLGPVVGNLSLGGFAFGLFGLYNDVLFGDIMVADVNVGYQFAKWFRANAGFMGIMPMSEISGIVGVFYIGAKFTIIPGYKE